MSSKGQWNLFYDYWLLCCFMTGHLFLLALEKIPQHFLVLSSVCSYGYLPNPLPWAKTHKLSVWTVLWCTLDVPPCNVAISDGEEKMEALVQARYRNQWLVTKCGVTGEVCSFKAWIIIMAAVRNQRKMGNFDQRRRYKGNMTGSSVNYINPSPSFTTSLTPALIGAQQNTQKLSECKRLLKRCQIM